jgi:hypothetical protein
MTKSDCLEVLIDLVVLAALAGGAFTVAALVS